MTVPLKSARKAYKTIFGFGFAGWAVALSCVSQLQLEDVSYRHTIQQQANAAFVLANANHLLVAQHDDIAQLLISNTAAGNAADLNQLKSDQAAFGQAMVSAALLSPVHAKAIHELRVRADQLVSGACGNAVELGAAAAADGPILASQAAYLAQCAPEFPGLMTDMNMMQNQLRNERNARITQLKAVNAAHIKLLFKAMLGGLLVMLAIAWLAKRMWLVRRVDTSMAVGAGGAR